MASERIQAKRAVLRSRIIKQALKAFASGGYEATTMTDIADRLKMTGPALYHYFPTKDALLFACLDQTLDLLLAAVADAAANGRTPVERMANVVRVQVGLELRQESAAALVNSHLYGPRHLTDLLDSGQRDILRLKQRALVDRYRAIIEDGVAAGDFNVDRPAIAVFNALAIIQYSGVWYRPRRGLSAADVAQCQVGAVLRQLGTRAALAPADTPAPTRRPSQSRRTS